MRKLIAKLALFTIVSILFSSMALADNPSPTEVEEAKKALDNAKTNPCIDNKADGSGADDGFLITIVEEPLEAKENNEGDFRYRICYRHTYQFNGESGDLITSSEFSNKNQKCYTGLPTGGNLKAKYSCKQVQVLLSKGGTSLLYGYIGMIYRWGASMVGIVAVLIIVISGIQISAAGGDQEAVTSSKKRILQSIAGIAVLLLSGLILYTVNPTFFVK